MYVCAYVLQSNQLCQQWIAKRVFGVLALGSVAGLAVYYIFHSRTISEIYQVTKFEDRLKEVCSNPKLPMLEYRGVQSFFHYLLHPDPDYCYSWVEFGGEKIPIPSQ
ncbi:hypothetical protein SK128_003992, partial [Halocaridina rubra]